MKSLFQLVIAGIIGGAIAFGAFKAFDKDTVIYEQMPAKTYQTNQVVNATHTSGTFSNTDVPDFVVAANIANPAVVHISAENEEAKNYQQGKRSYERDFWGYRRYRGERPQAGTGSGVVISKDGYIVTNNHVVGFADYIEVTMHDGTTLAAKKIGTDPSTDLAVIKIEGQSFPHLEMSNSDNVQVGQWVVAVGNPFNLTSTVTAGIVSAKGRDLDIIQGDKNIAVDKTIEEFIQTDAVVNPGNSGGALVNVNGDLIGINTAISSPTGVYAGYSFAIPSNLVKRVIDEIMEVGGDIQRAMLGVSIADISDVTNEGIKVGRERGVYIAGFPEDRYGRRLAYSSAEQAGIEVGDIIISVNNKQVDNTNDLQESLKFAKIGDTLDVTVFRNGRKKTIPVKLRQGI